MNIIHNDWPEEAFFEEAHPKDLIVLHHTVSRSAVSSEQYLLKKSLFRKKNNGYNIGVAYYVDIDGTTINVYDPSYWAYHIGAGIKHDQRSIGIEIANLGRLREKNGKYYDIYNQEVKEEEVYKLDAPWRNYQYYHRYTKAQVESVITLVNHLCGKYNIPKVIPSNFFPEDPLLPHTDFKGIATHVHFREKPTNNNDDGGKTDLSPAFKEHFEKFIKETEVTIKDV